MYAYTDVVTKTISLSDDAYDALVAVKRPKESFSELARRAAKELALRNMFDPGRPPLFTPADADAMTRAVYKARDDSGNPRYPIR